MSYSFYFFVSSFPYFTAFLIITFFLLQSSYWGASTEPIRGAVDILLLAQLSYSHRTPLTVCAWGESTGSFFLFFARLV